MTERCGIIFVHGIVGNNKIFDFLTPLVPENYECGYVSLKGHGGNALEFSHASMEQWRQQVEEAISDMATRCDRIIGIGHSMGCLLLMPYATIDKLSGLFLLNPPLRIRPRFSLLRNALKVLTGRTQSDPMAQAAKDAYGISVDLNPFHYYGWPKRYMELFNEISHVRKAILPFIQCPVKAMISSGDEMVSRTTEKIINQVPNVSTLILSHSTHYYYSPADREAIRKEFSTFIQ